MEPEANGKTAFVFAGGGSFGAIQVGMLRALVAHGVLPDFVVGASVGAINCAYFAGNPTLAGVQQLEQLWCGLKRSTVFPMTFSRIASVFSRSPSLVERQRKCRKRWRLRRSRCGMAITTPSRSSANSG